MAMKPGDIEDMIKAGIPGAKVVIRDLAGDGDHYAAEVVAEAFRGKTRVQQHKMVYDALKGNMGGVLHALALQTSAPENRSRSRMPGHAAGHFFDGPAESHASMAKSASQSLHSLMQRSPTDKSQSVTDRQQPKPRHRDATLLFLNPPAGIPVVTCYLSLTIETAGL
jgi:stress-induced morphogen